MDGKVNAGLEKGLSVLVPVYDWDSSALLSGLHEQGMRLLEKRSRDSQTNFGFELIVADDCSSRAILRDKVAASVQGLSCCRYFALEHNIGRAAVRNFLADKARFDKLLFIDCDAELCSCSFLEEYLNAAGSASDSGEGRVQVVCGGLKHPDTLPAKGMELRYRYEKKADRKRSAAYRCIEPYDRFTPFSFLIDSTCFNAIRFDESFSRYGYEDVLFGMELKRRNVPILHIDNPLVHVGLEDSRTYLAKTDTAVRNLYENMDRIGEGSSLLSCYRRLERLHLTELILAIGKCFDKSITANLTGRHPSLKLFSFYKLYRLAAFCKCTSAD